MGCLPSKLGLTSSSSSSAPRLSDDINEQIDNMPGNQWMALLSFAVAYSCLM
jgi:hypothetical protein